jgi:hypothetical protein
LSSYLEIAEKVLLSERRPLTARAILRRAYSWGIAPHHLYGKTQHKTLQARLSEDILHRREHSAFFRTRPGYFFLREFITDLSIPAEFRQPIIARRRTRDYFTGPALSLKYKNAEELINGASYVEPSVIQQIARLGAYHYVDPKKAGKDDVLLWAVSALTRPGRVLSYRIGKYRDNRVSFLNKRSIAFTSLVPESSHTLFDRDSLGVTDSALLAVATDLDIPVTEASTAASKFEHSVRFAAWQREEGGPQNLFIFVEVCAPDWFEPSSARLSLNEMHWLDLTSPPNNWMDFDPWSQSILSFYFSEARCG